MGGIRLASTFRGGIFIDGFKTTKHCTITNMPSPALVYIPLPQHSTDPCVSLVKSGDTVFKGQKIGDNGALTSPVHASVSGKVRTIQSHIGANGQKTEHIIIENDYTNTIDPAIAPFSKPLAAATTEEIINIIKNAGICNAGTTPMPIHEKISSALEKAKKLFVNCTDSEPYITVNHRLLLENAKSVIGGALIAMKALHIEEGVFTVENSKTDVIAHLKELLKNSDMLTVRPLNNKYPSEDDRLLVWAIEKIEIPKRKSLADIGLVVLDAETCCNIYNAFVKGLPQLDRVITVSGDCVMNPQNLRVAIGTPFADILNFCGGLNQRPEKIIDGGPMAGMAVEDPDTPVVKGTTAILALSHEAIAEEIVDPVCIHCGNCVSVCPMHLMPNFIAMYANKSLHKRCIDLNLFDCIECGCCAYICPAGIPLVRDIRAAKTKIAENTTQK